MMVAVESRQAGIKSIPSCKVSIIIKALNEERGIGPTIESALHAISRTGGEVILADSCSSDRTVEIAMGYPIRIVQLAKPSERSCGAGPQLGYQHSFGEFVYILDGDMKMLEGFLEEAIATLESHPDVAGVAGKVVELNTESLEYIAREQRAAAEPHREAGTVDRLDGGGLYRRSAIEAAGYFSDRNLHSYEEYDLGLRLRSLGWKLRRLPRAAVTHFGHDAPPYSLLIRRWRSRYVCGPGELLRAGWGQPRLPMLIGGLRELRIYSGVLAWWIVLASIFFWPLTPVSRIAVFFVFLVFPFLLMAWRKQSFVKATYAVVSWCFNTAGLIRGLVASRQPPKDLISSKILKEPVPLTL
jgi:glycosyltransferase involved in cell wall biosynthesis